MSLQIAQFNPEYRSWDRRQNSAPIAQERRLNTDRRNKSAFTSTNGNQESFFNKLKNSVDNLDKQTSGKQQALLYALSPIPTARRISSLPDTLEDKNHSRAGLLLGMAAANFPGDLTHLSRAAGELKNIYKEGFKSISKNEVQRQLAFVEGTLFEKLLYKINSPLLQTSIENIDKTLYDTKFGVLIKKVFKVKEKSFAQIKGVGFAASEQDGLIFSGNYFKKLIGKSLLRVSVLGLITSAILEVPAVVNSATKTKGSILDKFKAFGIQLLKSVGYIGIVSAGIATAGAILNPYGAIAGLVGMAIGSFIGLSVSKELNKQIDKIIT